MGAQEKALTAELLATVRATMNTQTGLLARLAGQIINDTLEVWSGVFPAGGVIDRQFTVPAGSIYVRNVDSDGALITVSSASPAANVPTGLGTALIGAGQDATVPLASHTVTLYGTEGDHVWFAVFTPGAQPGTG